MNAVALRALAPADAGRAALLRLFAPVVRPLFRDRTLRVGVYGAASVGFALVLAAVAPLALLTLGPLVLGVPHLASDVRYLVVRQGLHRRPLVCAAVAPFLSLSVLDPRFGWGLGAVAAAACVSRGSPTLRALALVACAALWLTGRALGPTADIVFAHAHNLVAGGFWIAWARGSRRHLLPAVLLFVLGVGLIFTGALEPLLFRAHGLARAWYALDAGDLVVSLSPVREPIWALRCLVFFAFAQAVHYGVWIRLVPEEDRARSGVRSFSSSYRALVADLGPGVVTALVVASAALWFVAGLDVSVARSAYLRVALFHGPLEIAVAVLLGTERQAVVRAG
jgi:hypothetical protein